jgi:curved DNA-binding protein CbpA
LAKQPKLEKEVELSGLDQFLGSLRQKNHYDVLDVPPDAGRKEIRSAYFRLVSNYHPDQHRHVRDKAIKDNLAEIFTILTNAYETLYSKKRRRMYDRTIPEVTGAYETEEEEALNALFDENGAAGAEVEEPEPDEGDKPLGWSFYETALDAFEMGDYQAADINFKLAAEMDPTRKEYQDGLAKTRKILGQEMLKKLKAEAKRLEDQRKFRPALNAYRQAAEIDDEDPELHYAIAHLRFFKLMDREGVKEDLDKALKAKPDHVDALMLMGRFLVWAGERTEAVHAFKRVLAIDPENQKAEQALELFGDK